MSNAVATTGTLIKRGDGASPEAFVTVAEIQNIPSAPGFSRNKLETSTHNDGVESYILGILRQKDPEFAVNYLGDDATHEQLIADILADTKSNWQFVLPSGLVVAGPARVQKFELDPIPVDGVQRANCGLSWAGPITWEVPA